MSKIIVSRSAGSRVSTPLNSDKSRVSNDVTPTVSEVGSVSDNDDDMDTAKRLSVIKKESLEYEALLTPSRCDHDDEVDICQFQTISTSAASSHLDTARDKRLPDIKKENLEYESLLVPSRCCDDDNEVEID